jgi:glucose-1-phosphate thymidylyltransferase
MKVVVPAAGQGTRLFPQTHTKPKPMVRVAGKPILGHILDDVVASPVQEVVIVVGVMQEKVVDYATDQYGTALELEFVEQDRPEGLGHAVYQARPKVEAGPLCIALGDMLFERGLDRFLAAHRSLEGVDGSIGVKRVDEPSNYGIVTVDAERVAGLSEKPDDPPSDLAISGIYFVEDAPGLFDALESLIEADHRGAGGEYQLTDALQRMLDRGAEFGTFDVGEWYDCGRPETLLAANRVLLGTGKGSRTAAIHDGATVVRQPADIGDDVTLEGSVVGPYVSIDDGAEVIDSHVTDAIVGCDSSLRRVNLTDSIVGDDATVEGTPNELNVGDSSDVRL